MNQRILAGSGLALLVLVLTILGTLITCSKREKSSISDYVLTKGLPSYLVKSFEIKQGSIRILKLEVLGSDPGVILDSSSMRGVNAVWFETNDAKQSAEYFFSDMKGDDLFDGGGWYSSRSRFGESVHIVEVDSGGKITSHRTLRVNAISVRVATR